MVADDGDGSWRVEFYGFTALCGKLDEELAGIGDVHERARRTAPATARRVTWARGGC